MVYRNHWNDLYIGIVSKSALYGFKTYIAELHLTKSQQVDYQIFGNILNRDYLNFNTPKVSLIFLKETIVPLIRIRV